MVERLSNKSKTLVAFYSWGGNTKAVAEYIAQKTDADILELIPYNDYSDDYNTCVSLAGKEGRNFEPELISQIPDIKKYDTIFVGSPCWWGTIANPLRTFLHQNDMSDINIVPFMTHGTSGICVQDISKLCPNSKISKGLSIYNCYQVTTKKNTISNMGDWKSTTDKWLKSL